MPQLVLLVIAGFAGYLAYQHAVSSQPTKSKLTPAQRVVLTCAVAFGAALVGALVARAATLAAIGGWLGFLAAGAFETERRTKQYGIGKHLWGVGAGAVAFVATLLSAEWCLAALLGFLAYTTASNFERDHHDDLWDIDASIWGLMTWFFFGVFLTSTVVSALVITLLPAAAAVVLYLRDKKATDPDVSAGASWPRIDASEEASRRGRVPRVKQLAASGPPPAASAPRPEAPRRAPASDKVFLFGDPASSQARPAPLPSSATDAELLPGRRVANQSSAPVAGNTDLLPRRR
jgi:hypothetical protein